MELIWLLFIAVVTINVTESKSLIYKVLEKDITETDVAIISTPLSPSITERRNIDVHPNNHHRKNNFVLNLKPKLKTLRQNTEVEKYRKPFMKKLSIKDVNNKNVKRTIEISTRKSLMKRTIFTVNPYDDFIKTGHKNGNSKHLGKLKSKKNFTKEKVPSDTVNKTLEVESENRVNKHNSTNHQNFEDYEKQNMRDNHNELRKSKRLLLFPKRNNTNHLKVNSKNKPSSHKDQYSYLKIKGDKKNNTITPKSHIKQDNKDPLEKVIKSKDNSNNQAKSLDKKNQDYNKDRSKNHHFFVDLETQNKSNNHNGLRKTLLLFPKRNNTNRSKVNTLPVSSNNKTSSDEANDQILNNKSVEAKEISTIAPEVFNHLDFENKLEEKIEPKENFTHQQQKNKEEETKDLSKDGLSSNHLAFDDFKTQNISNNYSGLKRLETNNKNHSKVNTLPVSSEHKTSFNNDQNLNNTIGKDKEISSITPEDFIKSDKNEEVNTISPEELNDFYSKNKLEEVIQPKEKSTNQKKSLEEGDKDFKHHGFHNVETQNISNNCNDLKSSEKVLLFPKKNTTNNLQINSLQGSFEKQPSTTEANDQNLIEEDEEVNTNSPDELTDFDSENKLEEVIQPKEKSTNQEKSMEEEDKDFKNHGFHNVETQKISNNRNELKSSEKVLLFPKKNTTNNLQINSLQGSFEKPPSTTETNDQNLIEEDEEVNTNSPNELTDFDSENKLEEVIEPKKTFSDYEKKDKEELIFVDSRNKLEKAIEPKKNFTDHEKKDKKEVINFESKNKRKEVNDPKKNFTDHEKKDKEEVINFDSKNKRKEVIEPTKNFTDHEKKDEEKINFNSKNKLETVIEPKETFTDHERKDEEEFIYVKKVTQKPIIDAKHVSDKREKAIGKRFRYYSFMKNKKN